MLTTIDSITIKVATKKIIDKYFRDKKRYCRSHRLYRLKCLMSSCGNCGHCVAVAFIICDYATNSAVLFIRKHKKIKGDDSNLIDYVTSIVHHECTHVALLNIGELSAARKYDNVARSIEERNGFPRGFFDGFDSESYRKSLNLA